VFLVYLAVAEAAGRSWTNDAADRAVVSLAIVVPWYVFVYREYGWQYIQSFVLGENLGRYAEAVGEQARGAFFYLPVMLADLFPWTLFVPLGLWWGYRHRSDRVVRLCLIWVAAIVVFFSLSGTKEDLYILPIVPAEAALIGAMTAAWRADERWPALWTLLGTGVLLV